MKRLPKPFSAGSTSMGYSWSSMMSVSGGFKPLRYVKNPNLQIVLGLVTSKHGDLEATEDIEARIQEAARYVDINQLCLSPQCGFASTEEGNLLTEAEQWKKLQHVIAIADRVWE